MVRVLMVAAEVAPFVKSGGLADVIGSLPQALRKTGVDVRIIMPKYEDLTEKWHTQFTFVTQFTVQVGWRRQYCAILTLTHEGIPVYLVENDYYFRRRGLYGYGDDAERFAYFSQAVVESLGRWDWVPDILHTHDWHTALVPVFLRTHYAHSPLHTPIKTMFTIHNIRYQGVYGKEVMGQLLNLGKEHDHPEALEYYGAINFMKGGIVYSDAVTTVSPTYAVEIQTPYYGEGLDGVLRARQHVLTGIVNGIDVAVYDPAHDTQLIQPFSSHTVHEAKATNKRALQAQYGLPVDPTVPLLAIVTRLVEQKGIDLLLHVMAELLEQNVQMVIIGVGDYVYEQALQAWAIQHPKKLVVDIRFDEGQARRVYAGADLFLMPSKFEPCGIGQMIAMRYGAVPIVRATGGLQDTVVPFNAVRGDGYGFTFVQYNAHDMLDAVTRALHTYHQEVPWRQLHAQLAQQDFSWDTSARQYVALYKALLG